MGLLQRLSVFRRQASHRGTAGPFPAIGSAACRIKAGFHALGE